MGGGAAVGGGAAFDAGPPPQSQLDPTWGSGGCVTVPFGNGEVEEYRAVAVAADGTVYAAGRVTAEDAGLAMRNAVGVTRFAANGQPDPAFGQRGSVRVEFIAGYHDVWGLFAAPDGVVVGVQPSRSAAVMLKLTPTGARALSFGDGGVLVPPVTPGLSSVPLVSDGDGFLFAQSALGRGQLSRLTATGARDPSFGVNGVLEFDQPLWSLRVESLLATAGGKFVVAGLLNNAVVVARVPSSDGGVDHSFGGRDGIVKLYEGTLAARSMVQLAEGSLRLELVQNSVHVLAGVFDGGTDRRLNRDGGTVPLEGASGRLFEVKPDVLGVPTRFTDLSSDPEVGGTDLAVALLGLDGGLVTSAPNGGFLVAHVPNTGATSSAATRQPDGKVLVVGTQSDATTRRSVPVICRLVVP